MIFIWRSYDFVLVISYICSIDVTLMILCNIFNFCWFIWLLSIVFFSPSFCSCYYGTMKRVYETSNLRLTFPCFRKFWVNPKDFTLKRHLISSALNSYKKVLMKKKFSPYCSQDPYRLHHFLEKCWHQQFFRAVFVNFHVWENFPQEMWTIKGKN